MNLLKKNIFIFCVFFGITLFLGIIYTLFINAGILSSQGMEVEKGAFIISLVAYFALGITVGILFCRRGLLFGIFYSIIMLFIAFLGKVIIENSISINLVKTICSILMSAAGGLIGVSIKK